MRSWGAWGIDWDIQVAYEATQKWDRNRGGTPHLWLAPEFLVRKREASEQLQNKEHQLQRRWVFEVGRKCDGGTDWEESGLSLCFQELRSMGKLAQCLESHGKLGILQELSAHFLSLHPSEPIPVLSSLTRCLFNKEVWVATCLLHAGPCLINFSLLPLKCETPP